jgi:hypothetical protein
MNLIFPIAGKGERFGGVFKPFLKIGDLTFIEKTIESFPDTYHYNIFFICTEEQAIKYDVQNELNKIFINTLDFTLITIPSQTSGPLQTIKEALKIHKISGPSIVCDCDHYFDAAEVVKLTLSEKFDAVIPTYIINQNDYYNWSKIVFDKNNNIIKLIEKNQITDDYIYKGIIGCIGFKNIENILYCSDKLNFISEYLDDIFHKNHILYSIDIYSILTYGDINMYNNAINTLRSKMTFFCDIDGVLLKHNNHSTNSINNNFTIDGFQKLQQLKIDGHKIILTTARNKKNKKDLEKLLKSKNIIYDELVMGCNPGSRILINDRKPSKPFSQQAFAYEVQRDLGLADLSLYNLDEEFNTKILGVMDGNSFAKTFLLEKDKQKIIRKYIIKNKNNLIHYQKLKRQCQDIHRFNALSSNNIVPKIISERDSFFDYFYDMEYLDGFLNLSLYDNNKQITILKDILHIFDQDIYSMNKKIDGINWLNNFLTNKIYSKLLKYEKIDSVFDYLINSNNIYINGKKYFGLRKIFDLLDFNIFSPSYISPIHGDMTLENIMYDGFHGWRLIDMDGSDIFDYAAQDLGKLYQSVLTNYQEWKNLNLSINYFDNNIVCNDTFFKYNPNNIVYSINNIWASILNTQHAHSIGVFYMSCYFIRFVSFRMQIGIEHGYFAIIMAIVWLTKIIEKEL